MSTLTNVFGVSNNLCTAPSDVESLESTRIAHLRKISYGLVMPIIGSLGVVGNVSNLIVLTRRNTQGTAYAHICEVYKVMLELLFKIGPTILMAALNLRIMLAYRRRPMLLLGSTSLLFFACVSPMILLNVTLDEDNLGRFSYQLFRALANLLEVTNYSPGFYIYRLFSEDFRGAGACSRSTGSPSTSHQTKPPHL